MSWGEERRANRVTDAQIRNQERAAAANVRITERAALGRERRADEAARAEQARATRDRRAARVAAVRAWFAGRVVELLIYPVAVLSFVLAAPAMAVWGHQVYGSALGVLLPGITELGMWAFAIAVVVSRRRSPDRPVVWLQAGVGVFAAVAFGANLLHGLTSGWQVGMVMGVVSVAGVVAHQLTLAAPVRSRAERQTARIERAAARKVTQVRRAAVAHAVAEIDRDGRARLVYAPGRYVLTRTGVRRRTRLEAAIVPGLPVAGESADWDRELADLLASTGTATATGQAPVVDPDPADDESTGGGVATADPGPDLHESTPDRGRIDRKPGRSLDQLRAQLADAIEAGTVNPWSAESIRKALRCSAKSARQLRDDYRKDHQ
ncbi:MAG TPA: hypothetical protein VJ870_04635 [Amycolatopsis sp.]|nr:hypothetical protein [Amycolatopsis sp.]